MVKAALHTGDRRLMGHPLALLQTVWRTWSTGGPSGVVVVGLLAQLLWWDPRALPALARSHRSGEAVDRCAWHADKSLNGTTAIGLTQLLLLTGYHPVAFTRDPKVGL